MICGVLRSRGVHVWIASHSQVKAGATIISVNTHSPTHFDIFCDTCLKRELLIPELITRRSAKKCEPCIFFPANKMQKKNKKKRSQRNVQLLIILSIMWPSSLFSSVYLPYGRQDVNGWPTRSPYVSVQKDNRAED